MKITYEVGGGLYVNVTNRCSNACVFCVRAKDAYGDLWLDAEPTREEILTDILSRELKKYPEIVFCGYGEPTYRLPDIVWTVENLRKTLSERGEDCPHIRINTNGQSDLIAGRDTAADYVVFDSVSISLNAANARKYQEICLSEFGESAYDSMINLAARLAKAGTTVIFSVVEGTVPPEDIEKCQKICESTGVKLKIRKFI